MKYVYLFNNKGVRLKLLWVLQEQSGGEQEEIRIFLENKFIFPSFPCHVQVNALLSDQLFNS